MSSSRSKGKSKSSSSSNIQYPTQWSEWVSMTNEPNTMCRYRLMAPEEYDYDYRQLQPENVPNSSTVPDNSLYSISENYSAVASQSNYTIAPSPSTDSMETITQGFSAASLQSAATGAGFIPRSVLEPVSGHIATKNPGSTKEAFDHHYKVHHAREFQVLSIFKVLWAEPKGNGGGNQGSVGDTEYSERSGRHGEKFYEKVRRFVIIDRREGHCICLPIMTYGGQGTLKAGVHPGDHTAIHTTEKPGFLKDEVKRGLKRKPIRVQPSHARHHLDKASRLNYAKVYTVEYNVKVWFVGKIHRDSEWQIGADYNDVHPPITLRGQRRLSVTEDTYSYTGGGTGPYTAGPSTYNTQTQDYTATTSTYPGASGTTAYSTDNTIAPNPEAASYYPPHSSSSYQPDEYAASPQGRDQYYGGKEGYYDER